MRWQWGIGFGFQGSQVEFVFEDIVHTFVGANAGSIRSPAGGFSGFLQLPDGLYQRFDETAFNTVFDMEKVKDALLDVGWKNAYFARIQDLKTPLDEPELEGRVFIVASK
jgi:hypothetical protein